MQQKIKFVKSNTLFQLGTELSLPWLSCSSELATVADKQTHQICYLKNMNFLGKTDARFELGWLNKA